MSSSASVYYALRADALANIEEAFLRLTHQAESERPAETFASVFVTARWRGLVARRALAYQASRALLIERVARGFLGRQRFRLLRRDRDLRRQRAFFDAVACTVQKRFRAYHSRKYKHNFYARKAYVAAVLRKAEGVRREIATSLDAQARARPPSLAARAHFRTPLLTTRLPPSQVREREEQREKQGRAKVDHLSAKLHHLARCGPPPPLPSPCLPHPRLTRPLLPLSTASCPGIYNSPYHIGFHPTAFGVPVEERLRTAIKPQLKREIAARAKTLRPLPSLDPIPPLLGIKPHDEIHAKELQEKWLSKTKRIGGADFLPTGAKSRKEPAHQSIHAGTLYHSQGQILERTVEKSKWVTDRPFYGSVPTNRIVTTAGSDPKYSL